MGGSGLLGPAQMTALPGTTGMFSTPVDAGAMAAAVAAQGVLCAAGTLLQIFLRLAGGRGKPALLHHPLE